MIQDNIQKLETPLIGVVDTTLSHYFGETLYFTHTTIIDSEYWYKAYGVSDDNTLRYKSVWFKQSEIEFD